MADLSITTSQVALVEGDTIPVIGGEVIAIGEYVYRRASDNKWLKARAGGTAEEAGAEETGMALSTIAAADQRLVVAKPGAVITLGAGAAPTAATPYFVSPNAGKLCPLADLVSTNKGVIAGLGVGSNRILLMRGYHVGSVKP